MDRRISCSLVSEQRAPVLVVRGPWAWSAKRAADLDKQVYATCFTEQRSYIPSIALILESICSDFAANAATSSVGTFLMPFGVTSTSSKPPT